jgi:glycerol-3-phosphate acyltransferase PlsY
MVLLRRIQACKWGGAALAVLFLSQCFRRWRAFSEAPTPATYAGILLALTLFLLLMAALAVVVYAEEKAKGRITQARPFFDRWSDRFFLNNDEPEAR